ncbi:PorP/SprF family type IX secretion system membrane protein [Lutibacter sp.]|uniref:PorP/SprF family type IX secretion system membrane protein n=1 Tax=Lutibacter sp. TaxID=1925666 RepID=UPI0027366F72|nr:PorP/SprF family type IX secretion system membrane protein [Lutibacter sp.]MDP3311893.1 PorP/SprF family type IX secretion system membrane protein [Lutibacter sp.]
MRKRTYTIVAFLTICVIQFSFGQDQYINNLNTMPNFVNPSFYGFRNSTKIGVLNKFSGKKFDNSLDQRYLFANTYFEQSNFSLGIDFYNSSLRNSGFSNTQAALSFIYPLELSNYWYLYAGLTAGFSSTKYNFDELVFQDQINLFTGQINSVSIDPLADSGKIGYADIGTSVLVSNDENLFFGLALKHLNTPKNTVNGDNDYKLEMLVSAQLGYEIDINRHNQNMLPRYSYLYLFGALSKQGKRARFDFYQELNLSTFSLGISQHLNYLEDFNMHEFGVNATIRMELFDVGLNYKMPFGAGSDYFVNNSIGAYLIFDLDPYRSGRRGDFSLFY